MGGNCCKFIKRSRYNNEKQYVDTVGSKRGSNINNFTNLNSNPLSFNNEPASLQKKNSSKSINSKNSNNQGSGSHQAARNGSNANGLNMGVSFENKSEDGNVSIPHIADFYPEDGSAVPADNPRTSTLFLPKASVDKKKKWNESASFNVNSSSETNLHLGKKCNSCSTIYIDDSTVSQPNLKSAIRLVACAIHYHIKRRTSDRSLSIFDEKLYPLSRDVSIPNNYDKIVPEHRAIYKFMKNLFTSAQLTAECAIVTLIYLERVLTYAEIDLCPANWKRLLLGAILLASKVWDDQAVWNVDYCQILKDINVENMNELERQYLNLLQFNINVPSSVYAKYYFDLRTLAEDNNLSFPHQQLTKEKALKLEAMSSVCQEKYKDIIQMQMKYLRRATSADNLFSPSRKSLVIIS